MSDILIFAGTTEGRRLAEFCAENEISADVSAATEYGSALLPQSLHLLTGRLQADEIKALLRKKAYVCVIDATHPYAAAVTGNIRAACTETDTAYYRLLREQAPVFGETVQSIDEMIRILNQNCETILSTLGSKSAAALTTVTDFRKRIWLRLLPTEENIAVCTALGYAKDKLILQKGPFTAEENMAHIRQSGAKILLTKESGAVGGYPEKAEAVHCTGIRMLTLCRPPENGAEFSEITRMLISLKERGKL